MFNAPMIRNECLKLRFKAERKYNSKVMIQMNGARPSTTKWFYDVDVDVDKASN